MILRADKITFGFSTDPLLKDSSFQIQEGDKIALIGPNGTGKTTLLKILTGEITSYDGKIIKKKDFKIGFQEQFRISDPSRTLWKELENEFTDVIKKINHDFDIDHEHLAFEKKIRSILKGMGFSEVDWQRELGSFSGGELTRISLARLFLRDYDLLILDEPTNHLDIASVFWLESFLKLYRGTLLMVTHDRELLGGVVNQIFEINSFKIWDFRMTYKDYLLQRERMIESKKKEKKKLENELDKQKKLVKQFETWGHMGNPKAISLMHSREKMVARVEEKLEENEIMEENQTHLGDIPKPERSNYVVFECTGLKKIFDNKKTELSLVGHGYLDMFYSKRKLISNYFIYKSNDKKNIVDNDSFKLKEEMRPDSFYPILEDEAGTHIFRDKALNSFAEFNELKMGLDDFFIERIFMSDEEYYDSIAAYQDQSLVEEFLIKYQDNYNKGFYYQYTEKLKGDLNEN